MKKIIIAILCSTMFISNGFAISIIDAIQHSNSRGISQCSDRIASNYGAMAPCLYIRESAPRVMVAPHHNANISRHSNRVNPFHSNGHSANLVDTSAWHMTHTPTVTHTRTTNNTAINSEFIITQLEEFMSNTNNLSFKILNEDTVYITIDSDTTTNKIRIVMPVSLADSNNQWNKDVIIIASATDNRFAWDYVVVDMDANILASGVTVSNVATLKAHALVHTNTTTVVTPTPTVVQAIKPVYVPTTTTTTKPVAADLTFKINYKLGTQNADGSYKLDSATCNTNGSVDLIWIEKLVTDNYYGVGIEINNTFGSQTYKVNKGDRLCCRVSRSLSSYQKAGGCTVVQ